MATDSTRRSWPRGLALGGLALVLLGVVGYFVMVLTVAAWMPRVRNDAVPNWIAIALGVGMSALAVGRAASRRTPAVVLAFGLALAGVFASFLYVYPVVRVAVPPSVGSLAPDFALRDQTGRLVRRDDFRGSPLLLVFYRGHW